MPADPSGPAIIQPGRLDTFKQWARRVTLASVFANAAFGILMIAGPIDDFGAAALATSLLLTAAGVTSVACAAAIPDRRIGWLIPLVGATAAVVGFALLIGATWNDFEIKPLWRAGGSAVAVAVAIAYASLLSDVHLAGWYRRLLWSAYLLLALGAVFTIAVVWDWEPGQGWRLFAILAVLLGAITIAIPVVDRLQPAENRPPPIRHCPYCGAVIEAGGLRTTCEACGRRFRVSPR